LNILPFRKPDSYAALATFAHIVDGSKLPTLDVDAVLLRCLAVLDLRSGPRIPGLVERYLVRACAPEKPLTRFVTCVEELLRHHAISDGFVQEAIECIRTYACEPTFTPQRVAEHVGARLATLDVAFRRQVGCTVTEKIRERRLAHSAFLLITSRLSIKEVWAAVGYNHHSNFDHDFTRRFGTSPRQFRDRSIRPLAQNHYAATQSVAVGRTPPATKNNLLIVDDDEGTRTILGCHLRNKGYRVSVASTGAEGLELATQDRPDTILLDYHLGDMDGLAFLRALRYDRSAEHPSVSPFTADWELFDRAEEVHALNAMIASKLCDLDEVEQLIAYVSVEAGSLP
jgi:CheY-like chemotaxis protein/AraC-like DNA-binding protein